MAKDLTGEDIRERIRPYGLELGKWTPGDGWTRYRIEINGGSREESQQMTLIELRAWFRGFMYAKTGRRY